MAPPVKEKTPPWQRTLYVLLAAQVISMVGFSSIFPFLALYVQELGSRSGLTVELLAGMVFSSQAVTMMLASPVWGALADRYGRKLMVERAMFGGALIVTLMAFVRSAEELVALRAVQGLISGTIGAANALVAGVVPRARMGYAMGLLQVGMGFGLALGPLVGGTVADAFDYRAAFFVTGGLLVAGGLLVLWGIHEDFTPAAATEGQKPGMVAEWGRVLRAPGVVPAYAMRFVNHLGRMIVLPIAPLFVASLMPGTGRVNTWTGLLVGAASAATSVSAIFLGRLGDRIGHRRILVASTLGTALFFLPQALVQTGWQLVVLHALAGACIGGIVPAISALLARFTRPGEEGAVYGLDNSVSSAGRALAPMLGVWVALILGLRAVFVATALLYLVAAAMSIWALPADPSQDPRASNRGE